MKTIQSQIARRTVLTVRFTLIAFFMAFLGLEEVAQSQISTPFWDGTDTVGGNGIDGGSGTWDLTTTNWTDSAGRFNGPWQGLNAIFSVTGGTVTVVNVIPTITGMQFTVNGYEITATAGNSLQLSAATPITVDPGVTATISAPFGGVGGITVDGAGTLVLSGLNTYTGATTISLGTLRAGAINTLPSQTALSVSGTFDLNNFDQSVGSLSNDGTITLGSATLTTGNDNTSTTFSGAISGTGGLTKVGTGTLTLFGTDTYTGATTVNGGTLVTGLANQFSSQTAVTVGAGANLSLNSLDQSIGSLAGAGSVTMGGLNTLTLGNDNTSTTFSGTIIEIRGAAAVIKVGTGTQTLSGTSNYTGGTTVNGGTLLVDGSLLAAGPVTVNSGATLGGAGSVGLVTIADGGILAPGDTVGSFTMSSLALSNASLLNYELGTPGVTGLATNDLGVITNDLTLDGVLNTTALAGFGPGGYRLFNFGGALTDNTLDIGTVPAGFQASNFIVVTGVPNEVDLLVLAGPTAAAVQFWDGPNTKANGVIDGGTGNWDNFATNWTDASGAANSSWLNGVAVFAGTAGTVTVTQSIFFTGLEFMTGGYQIDLGVRGSLNLIGSPTITTDTGITTITATLDGAGGIIKDGPGTLVLSGTNTYLGSTAINGGTLSISSDANLGTAPGAVVADRITFDGGTLEATTSFTLDANRGITLLADGGTIGVTGANVLSYGGVIIGSGSLSKTDTGTLVLLGANNYTGATAVDGGTLTAGIVNTLPGQTALTVAAGAAFELNNFSQSIGSLAGAGDVSLGTATLTTGSQNTDTDFSGIISGAGALTKVGLGAQTLSGGNTYSGPTTIDAGSLIVDGSIVSAQTFVNSGGLLGGVGLIGGSLVNSGIVSPGHSPGTLTVGGNYAQTAGGTLRMEVGGLAAGDHDLLMVNGTATLAGTLQVIRLNNFQFRIGDQLTLLIANGGLTGTFDPIENDFFVLGTFAQTQIAYFPNSVVLEQLQGSFAEFASVFCFTPNHVAVGAAIDSAVGDPRAAELIDFLNSESLDALCRDLELISPEELVPVFNINVSLANVQTANLERRMDDIRAGSTGFSAAGFGIKGRHFGWAGGFAGPTGPEGKSGESVFQPTPDNRWGVFITGLGEFTNVDDTSNVPGYDLSTGGLTFGIDYRIGSNFAIGLTGGYAHTNAELVDNGHIDVDGGKLGFYATAFSGGFYVDAAVNGGFGDYDTRRTALLGDARGSTDGGDVTALLSTGYDWRKGGLTIGPIAHFQYTYVNISEFTESGSLAPLIFNDQSAESFTTAIGFKTSYEWKVGSVLLKPELRASWQHEFGDTDYSLVSRFANGAGSSFTVHGPTIGRDSLLIGAGAAMQWNDRISAYAYYDGDLGRTNYVSHNISAGIRVNF